MNKILIVALGGALGSVFRYLLTASVPLSLGNIYLYGTLIVNLIGSFIIGALWSFFENHIGNQELRIFLIIGILGGFTTFSSYALEVVNLLKLGEIKNAILYILATNILGILAAILGYWLSLKLVSMFQ